MNNVMKLMVMASALSMVACGSNGSNGVNGTNAPLDSSVLSKWTNTDSSSRIPTLDLSQVSLNTVQDVSLVVDCVGLLNGAPDESGTSPAINGVGKNQVLVTGSTTSGLLQFGPLSHATHDASDVCYTVGQEQYTYAINGNTLTVCDAEYTSCATFTK